MAQEIINLDKTVYNNKKVNDVIDRNFSSLIQSQIPINLKRFFDIYRELFYKINKTEPEAKSHWGLILESQDYINNYIDPRDKIINELIDRVGKLEQILFDKQIKTDNSHPLYPDGTFLRSPARNPDGLPIWIMDNGSKREIKNYETYKSLKRAANHAYDANDDAICRKLEIETLDGILDGPPILTDNDLNITNFLIEDLDITLQGITDYTEAEITCLEGVDVNDVAPFNTSQYTSRFSSCTVQYNSLDIEALHDVKEITETIYPGDSITIKYRKDNKTSQSSLNVIEGFTQEKIIRDTAITVGPPVKQDNYGNWLDINHNFVYRYYDLPGVPYSLKKERLSSYGTRMVQNTSRNTDTSWWLSYNDHGWNNDNEKLIQERLWEEVFNDPQNIYYDNTIVWNGWQGARGGLYGEPIYFITSPVGEEEGHNNYFAVKAGTNLENIIDPFGGGTGVFWQKQYYVILNKGFEPYDQTRRLKSSLGHEIRMNLLTKLANMYFPSWAQGGSFWQNSLKDKIFEFIRSKSIFELEQIATQNEMPVELLTNNWWVTMDDATRSNQKLIYPGFDNLY